MKQQEYDQYIGIDPGLTGAISFINMDNRGKLSVFCEDMPTIDLSRKEFFYSPKIKRIVRNPTVSVKGDYIDNHLKTPKSLILKGKEKSIGESLKKSRCSKNIHIGDSSYETNGKPLLDKIGGGIPPFSDIPVAAAPPVCGNGKSKIYFKGVYDLLASAISRFPKTLIVIENQYARPVQGTTSAFSLGHSFGGLMAIISLLGVPFLVEDPNLWKRKLGVIGTDKSNSISVAKTLYPDADLTLKKHHNRAEAILIAHHGLLLHR